MLPSREDASEALQETIVILWQKFGEFDSDRDFKSWACGFARNKALALLRDRKRDRHIFDDDLVNRLADDTIAMERRDFTQREALEVCLQKLPAARREMVLAAYTKGTRMDDLATERGQTPMSFYKLLHRIRRALLECVRRTLTQEEIT
jgi:RNA polymerase sigma-70 factor (ECF subfamily)